MDYMDKIFFHTSEHMEEISDRSVQLVVTSPPYNVSRSYGKYGGKYTDDLSWSNYEKMLRSVFRECMRVLKFDGTFFLNIGNNCDDQFKCHNIAAIATDIGFTCLNTIIWDKPNYTPTQSKRLANAYEYIFVFSKDSNLDNVKLNKMRISTKYFGEVDSAGKFRTETWRAPSDMWRLPVANKFVFGAVKEEHNAMFHPELPRYAIEIATDIGDLVLEPFTGSGTTPQVAKYLGRHYVGYELDKTYEALINAKIARDPIFKTEIQADIAKTRPTGKQATLF